jgi:hypothetical protein
MTRLLTGALAATLAALLQTRDCAGSRSKTASAAPSPVATAQPTAVPSPSPPPAPTEAPDFFAGIVRPILKAHCSPCHEPGGRLYDRLPFDNPKVISSHPEQVLRRLKGEDKEAVERWLATQTGSLTGRNPV